jgi:RNA polymerase sigma-70 factor (ECF subfamily)
MRDDGDPEGLLDLIRRAAGGDRRAFDRLVVVKRERVVRTAYQVTGDLEDARDVAQSVFLRLWRVLPRFDPGQRFDTWLYRITVNAAIDLLRSRGPKGMLQPLPEDPSVLGADDTAALDLDAGLDLRDLQRAFTHLAARLSPKQRAAFVLREIEGLETVEVARILDVTESTVRNHLLQARRTLRAGLEREYPGLCPPKSRKGGSE